MSPLGPTGTPNVPGNIPQMNYQMPDALPLSGSMGMNTGRGGGRNKGKE